MPYTAVAAPTVMTTCTTVRARAPLAISYTAGTMRNSSNCLSSARLALGSTEKTVATSVSAAYTSRGRKKAGAANRARPEAIIASQHRTTTASRACAATIDTCSAATKPNSDQRATRRTGSCFIGDPRRIPRPAPSRGPRRPTPSRGRCRRRHRKSPGSHTRWSQGRHGSSPASTVSTAAAPPRHGPQTAGVVGPKSTTIGVAVVAATWAGPLSPPRNRLARAIRPRSSPSPRSQATAMAPASTPRPSASAPHLLGPRRLRRTGREDDTTIRLSGREPGRDVGKRRLRPPPELVAGADVHDDELVGRVDAERAAPLFDPAPGLRVLEHLDRVARRRRPAEFGQQRLDEIPLVLDRVALAVAARPRHPCRVHPAAAGNRVADALAGSGGEGEQRTARPAVEVDDRVEARSAQPQCQRGVDAQPRRAVQ